MTYRHGSEAEADELPGGFTPFRSSIDVMMARAEALLALRACCESPIEIMLGAELLFRLPLTLWRFSDLPRRPDRHLLVPQFQFGRFRWDFAILFECSYEKIFIECDGAEFHSSPLQLARDRVKDRLASEHEIAALRFSGSEINYSAAMCVSRILPLWEARV